MTPRELHKQAMKLRIEAGKLDAEAIRAKERNRIIALINQLEEVSFVSDADQDYIIGDALDLIELIKGETNE